jgi:hypothetical protein
MSAYCSLADVKQRMSGDVPTMSTAFDNTITALITDISDTIDDEIRQLRAQPDGWTILPGSPTTRRYTGSPYPGSDLLLIDDAVAVSSVALLDVTGNVVQTLVAGTDWLPFPLNTLPIIGLTMTRNRWPSNAGGVQVGLTPGYSATVPTDLKLATVDEVIRAYRSGLAGETDTVGIEPFRPQPLTRALLASTYRAIHRYRLGSSFLRSPS